MTQASLLGEPGTGRTTFLALFYLTLVRMGAESEGQVRCHVGPEELDLLGALYEQVRSGEFPTWPEGPGTPQTLHLTLGYPESRAGGFLARTLHSKSVAAPASVEVTIHRPSAEDVSQFVAGKGALTHGAPDLLGSAPLLFLLDGGRFPSPSEPTSAHPQDASLAQLLGALDEARALHPGPSAPPVLWLAITHWDRTDDGARRHLLRAHPDALSLESSERELVARALLDAYLPRTSSVLRSPASGRPRPYAPVRLYLSWVRTAPAIPGQAPRLEGSDTPTRGWEPTYPFEEFRALAEDLRRAG